MLKRFVLTAVILSLVFAARMASATTVELAFQSVPNYEAVNITAYGTQYNNVEAGNYVVSVYTTNPNNAISLSGFCYTPVLANTSYTTYDLEPITKTSGGSAYQAIAWILNQQSSQGWNAAAAQAAVWELAWDYSVGNPFSLTSGNFILSSPDPNSAFGTAVQTIYSAALTGMLDPNFDPSKYVLAESSSCQGYVIPNPVPVPPTVLLLGTGLVGMAALRRRKGRAG
jgi:hypothetical protein